MYASLLMWLFFHTYTAKSSKSNDGVIESNSFVRQRFSTPTKLLTHAYLNSKKGAYYISSCRVNRLRSKTINFGPLNIVTSSPKFSVKIDKPVRVSQGRHSCVLLKPVAPSRVFTQAARCWLWNCPK